jgi:hypothetical protein
MQPEIVFTVLAHPRKNKNSVMKTITLLLTIGVMTGCVRDHALHTATSSFNSPRIERELSFYVATHPSHATNNFFVCPIELDHGRLVRASVYWKEERTLLSYTELEPDAAHDLFAWQGHELKLDRDTVDTPEEVAGSNYLETHRQWADSVARCIATGKHYCVREADARRLFPSQRTNQK